MRVNENINIKAKERFSFISLGKNLNVQRAWLLIAKYMSNQIVNAIQNQNGDNIFSLKDTASFEICRQNNCIEGGDINVGDIIFHVPLSVTKVSPEHYAELFRQLNPPIVSIGQQNKEFCIILTASYKPNMDLLVRKDIAVYYSEWKTNINIDMLRSSYSIPTYLYINTHIQHGQKIIDVDLSDLSQALFAGKYEYFCDFKKRILTPVKADFDNGLLAGADSFTFDYEINRKKHTGKVSEISLTLNLIYRKENIQKEASTKTQNKMEPTEKYGKYIQLLEANKNLILTGAPGTGKTFMAKEIAKALILKKVNFLENKVNATPLQLQTENRIVNQLFRKTCKMVQFHPSYDYSDFVEGLRPIMKSDNQIGFDRVNGVFKDFCVQSFESAIVKKKSDAKVSLFNNTLYSIYSNAYYEAVRNILDYDGYFSYYMDQYSTDFSVEEVAIVAEGTDPAYAYTLKFNDIQWIDKLSESFQLFEYLMKSPSATDILSSQAVNIYRRNSPSQEEIETAINNNVVYDNTIEWNNKIKNFDIAKLAKSYKALFDWVINYAKSNYEIQFLPKVFIIDEINRGEISKIFGELFFSIDPGYRGEYDEYGNDNKVQTQYQNLIPKEGDINFDPQNADFFRHGFYVPENVYIIGTMNDIDRSVESMDFAMHRRFAFENVSAEESYHNMIADSSDFTDEEKAEIKRRMSSLNNAILNPELRLGEAYQIGAAYFRKLLYYKEQGMEQAFKILWNNHLKGLLFEYLRGNQNAEAQLKELENAYNKKVETHEGADTDNR